MSLGTVSATDPEDAAVSYSIEAGDSGGLFAIDSGTGALSYQGAGEDYESGTTSYELTVRASDGGLHSDVTVTVNVTDVAEAPAFAEASYAFDLVENTDGGAASVALGAVSATDPENSTITYSIEAGDSGGLFEIDAASGEVFYIGAGEDYESGTTRYELTVRASDGSLHSDVTVAVNVTDVEEYVILAQEATETQQSVSEPDGEDLPVDVSTTGQVAVGGSATGNMETAGDRDWFAVELDAGKRYRIDLEGSRTGAGTLINPYLRGIHDSEGVRIAGTTDDGDGVGYNSRVFFRPEDAGTYYVAAGATPYGSPHGRGGGTYRLSVNEVADDFKGTTQTTGRVAVGGSATGEIEFEYDRDWFAVELDAGRHYQIDLEGSDTGAGTQFDPYLRGIHDADGVRIAGTTDDNGGAGNNSRVYFWAEDAGTYYVAAGAGSPYLGTYTLSVTEYPDDFTGGTGATGAVEVDGSATGEIEFRDDRDWFAVTLEAGSTYRIDLKGVSTGGGTLGDPYLYGIHRADGRRIAGTTDDNGGPGWNYDSRVTFTPQEAATYYVEAGAYYLAASAERQGTYTLSVTEIVDDFAADTGTSGAVEVDGSATGEIDGVQLGGDRDWFAVNLEAGRTYRIDLKGSYTGAGTLGNPFLHGVYDADGVRLARTTNNNVNNTNSNSRVYFSAEEDATYYVAAGAWADGLGTYTLSVRDVTDGVPDDFEAETVTSGAVEVGGSARGKIEFPGDQDWFAVDLEEGTVYLIDLKGSDTWHGTLVNPYLRGIYDADGVRLADTTDDDDGPARNSYVEFTAEDTATYYVAAGASGDQEGTYKLSVTEYRDDFEADTGTSGVVEVGGSATGEIESRGDRDWFAVTLEAGRTYQIDLEGARTGHGNLWNPYLYGLHDADGNRLAGTKVPGVTRRVFLTAEDAGAYYVTAGAWGYELGTYTLSVTEIPDDFGAGTGTSGAVEVGGSATGEIDYGGDHDWFAVTVEAGRIYRVDLRGSQTGDGTLVDPYLHGVHDADGNLLPGTTMDNGGMGPNSRVYFTAEDAGAYYVAAGGYFDLEGTYTLSVTESADVGDDYADGTGTTGTVEVGESVTGEIDYSNDRDWFAVTLVAGKTYQIDLEGSETGGGTLPDPYLRGVHDADGNLLPGTTDDDGGAGRNSYVEFTAAAAATYYVAAGGYDGNQEGTYTLSVVEDSM